jgi:hypothetical protein
MWYNAESMNEAEKCIEGFKLEDNMKERSHMQDLDVDGRMIVKWILKKQDVRNVHWLKMESNGRIL